MDTTGVSPSPFRELLGLRIVELAEGFARIELEITPPLTNFVGTLNGGVIASMIDMAGALSGCFRGIDAPPDTAITLSLAVNFISAASAGTVRAVGRTRGEGRRIFTASIDIVDARDRLIATGQGTFRRSSAAADG